MALQKSERIYLSNYLEGEVDLDITKSFIKTYKFRSKEFKSLFDKELMLHEELAGSSIREVLHKEDHVGN